MNRIWNLVIAMAVVGGATTAFASPPQAVHYQGYLTDADGNQLDATVDMEFRLYDVEVAGEAFWETDGPLGVDVESGVFRVNLAPVTAEHFAGGEVWLGITIIPAEPGEPAAEMEPRLKVLSVPYALVADHAATADIAVEAGTVTNVDFNVFATGNDVQDVLGVCIQEGDLSAALEGYCASPCYGDADVELFVTENGYVTLNALALWVEENVIVEPDEEALAAYLAENGYMTEEDLLWFLGEAGYPDADSVVLRDGTKSLQGDWDVGGNQLLNFVVHNSASDTPPEEPSAGQLWWDTTEKLVKIFDGESWQTVGGGDAAFASDCDTIDGLDSTAFEPFGAVAGHEAAYGHLNAEQLATLTGGAESNADALHSHQGNGGGLSGVNPDLLDSVFTEEFCAEDTPQDELATEIGQAVSTLAVPVSGKIQVLKLSVAVTHSNAAGLKVELERNTDKLVVSEIVELDDSGNWDIDLTSSLQDKDVSGNWILTISDLNGNDGKLTLADWCISVTYMSSDTVEVKGKLVLNGSDVAEDLASVGIHRKHFSDAAERTHTGDAVLTDTATTFNVAHGENALLLGLRVSCEERNSSGVGGHSTSVGLKISGVALGTYSIGRVGFMEIMTDYGNSRAISNHYITNTNTSFGSHNSSSNQYQAKVVHIFASLLLPDADTDFTITIQASHAADTAYVRNVVIDAVYVSGYTED